MLRAEKGLLNIIAKLFRQFRDTRDTDMSLLTNILEDTPDIAVRQEVSYLNRKIGTLSEIA